MKPSDSEAKRLKPFVVARINPIRFQKNPTGDLESVLDKMIASAKKFDPGKVKPQDLQGMGGAPPSEE